MRRWHLSVVSVMGIVLAVMLAGVGEAQLSPGDQAPNFTVYLHDSAQTVSLYDYTGEIVVLDFFHCYCGPCHVASSEFEPHIQQYYDQRGGNAAGVPVQVMSISVSYQQDDYTDQYISDYGLDLVLDDFYWAAYSQYSSGYVPQFAIINGVQQSNYDPWEVLYMQTGYDYGYYLTFRDYIDQVVPSLLGDANGDRKVNDLDASILGANWMHTGVEWADGDFNRDNVVNDKDAAILAAHWGETGPSSSVPDPATWVLVASGFLVLAARRRLAGR
ncbi:MAG: redoxin domain-containing protein [Planctomycetia bacterium]|nr:redoxin domain-containing protein [Planctomycetia bacterium]